MLKHNPPMTSRNSPGREWLGLREGSMRFRGIRVVVWSNITLANIRNR